MVDNGMAQMGKHCWLRGIGVWIFVCSHLGEGLGGRGGGEGRGGLGIRGGEGGLHIQESGRGIVN